jgi:L-2-hydroxyglutarate oxidase LhgO
MQTESKTELKNEGGVYTTKGGEILTSEQIAEMLTEAIEHYNNQIKSTTDVRKIKKLKDKLRNIKIWINQHDDVRQFIKWQAQLLKQGYISPKDLQKLSVKPENPLF